jgi:hypothetical protein
VNAFARSEIKRLRTAQKFIPELQKAGRIAFAGRGREGGEQFRFEAGHANAGGRAGFQVPAEFRLSDIDQRGEDVSL